MKRSQNREPAQLTPEMSRRTVLVGDILNVDSMTFNCKFKEHDGILNRSIGLDNFRMIIEIIHPLFVSSSSS